VNNNVLNIAGTTTNNGGTWRYGNISLLTTGWTNIAISWQNFTSEARLYLNGVYNNSINVTGTSNCQWNAIGAHGTSVFNGTIDEIRVWNRTLSDSEITDLYSNIASGNSLMREWTFNESGGYDVHETAKGSMPGYADGSKRVTNDTSIYRKNGTVYSATWNSVGKYGGAYDFDGMNDYIAVSSFNAYMFNLTVCFWYKGYGAGVNSYILGINAGAWRIPFGFEGGSNSKTISFIWQSNGGQATLSAHVVNISNWNFVCGVRYNMNITNTSEIYINGILNNTGDMTRDAWYGSTSALNIGSLSAGGYLNNGSIDELRIWNRSLTAVEIKQQYYSNLNKYEVDKWLCYVNESGLTVGNTYSYFGSAKDSAGNENGTETRYLSVSLNTAPTNPTVTLNSTDGSNKTAQDLHCYATITDPDTNTMNVSVLWYMNSILNFSVDYNDSYANGTWFDAILGNGNTTKGENWSCGMRLFDGQAYSDWVNTTNLTILNTPPVVALTGPDDSILVSNRTSEFNWTGTDDDAGDSLTYEINITLVAASLCGDAYREVSNFAGTEYAPETEMRCLYDNLDYYTWSARASDGEVNGSWAPAYKINITSLIVMSLPTSLIEFGKLNYLGSNSNDTADNSPLPFVIQNDGNCFVNVSIAASSMWKTLANPNSYYQFKVNLSNELNSFNWETSTTSWTDMPLAGVATGMAIAKLNYSDTQDSAAVDIRVQVPSLEPPLVRNSTVVFTSSLGE
jgi:hypothetical protein